MLIKMEGICQLHRLNSIYTLHFHSEICATRACERPIPTAQDIRNIVSPLCVRAWSRARSSVVATNLQGACGSRTR